MSHNIYLDVCLTLFSVCLQTHQIFPRLITTASTATSAGVIPGIRVACPKFSGFTRKNFSRAEYFRKWQRLFVELGYLEAAPSDSAGEAGSMPGPR